jgi:transposase-like protein
MDLNDSDFYVEEDDESEQIERSLPEELSVTKCELVSVEKWPGLGQKVMCKKLSTAICSPDKTLSVPFMLDVTILNFKDNKEIQFLPIKLYQSVPNLLLIDAGYCSVKAVSKENFEKLNKLEELWLYHNEITAISDGTFADLVSLRKISLGLSANSDLSEHFIDTENSSENSFQKRTKSFQLRETSFHHRFPSHTWIFAPTFASMTNS